MVHVPNSVPATVLSFVRENEKDKVFAVFNFSKDPVDVKFTDGPFHGSYKDYFSGMKIAFPATEPLQLEGWGWRVYVRG